LRNDQRARRVGCLGLRADRAREGDVALQLLRQRAASSTPGVVTISVTTTMPSSTSLLAGAASRRSKSSPAFTRRVRAAARSTLIVIWLPVERSNCDPISVSSVEPARGVRT